MPSKVQNNSIFMKYLDKFKFEIVFFSFCFEPSEAVEIDVGEGRGDEWIHGLELVVEGYHEIVEVALFWTKIIKSIMF